MTTGGIGTASVEAEVAAVVDEWVNAERAGDADALDRIIAPGFPGIGPLGFRLDRDQWLDRYRSGDLTNDSFAFQDPDIRVYDNTTAIVIGVQDQDTWWRGYHNPARLRATLVLLRRESGWMIANIQLSNMAES
ncbi:nuclear transport factor 2 family protein [Spiractinospora alimapuensis]|uniref:nuclear transport factor 2 family protein n=1 Tax=Spiractinospora alimapuensis TaxID=2820884 RepID=UPI001F1BE294|nr:nuclear transport factor 2 family protein [Spiractinospora alimapuensis]QVQ51417.1 nuclear transport factor 2 family protein [Spiractinospora alimapuensis]